MTRLRSGRALRASAIGLGLLVASGLLAACGGNSPYTVQAVFQNAEGLFPGNAVEILGVQKGSVTEVQPVGDHVVVTMAIDGGESLPAGVHAALTTPQLLGEPSIELSPAYTRGASLAAGSVIPESQTSVPISTDQLLRDLQSYLDKVNPRSLGGAIENLASDLRGQGQGLNQLISQGASTLNVLAEKGSELGQLNGSLAQITGTLDQRTANVTQLIRSYEVVANVIAQDSGPLGDAITQLANTSQQLSELLDPNLQPLQSDIATITQVGRTLDRNIGSLDQGLSSTVSLFQGAGRAYDPVNNWLNLNVPVAPGLTATVVTSLVRDRLAGICRRVLADHSSGLSSSQISTLQTCGDPGSGFFDPLLAVLPDLLNRTVPGSTGQGPQPAGPTAQSVMANGVSQIPGLSQTQVQRLSQVPASSLSGNSPQSSTLDTGSQLNPSPPQSPSSSGGGLLGGLVHGLLGVGHFFGSLF